MPTIEQALAVVDNAEKKLRELVGVAASAGEYDLAMRVAQWAKLLATLPQSGLSTDRVSDARGQPDGAALSSRIRPSATSQPGGSRSPARPRPAQARRSPAKGEYPKFFRRGDQLVKVGWSKKDRAEYEHKAPRRCIELLADAIGRRGGNGKLFTSDDVLPIRDPTDGCEIPGYQAYVALAWLKATGVIKQNGRRGYSAKKGGNVAEEAAALWAGLPEQEA